MTIFGWFYLVLTVIGAYIVVSEVGKPKKPLTAQDAALKLLVTGLLFWGLYVWGLR